MIEALYEFPQFKNVPKIQLEWLAEELEIVEINEGEYLFKKGDPINNLFVIFSGEFEVYTVQNKTKKAFSRILDKEFSGLLPFSRAKNALGYAVALKPSVIGNLSRENMKFMIQNHYELTEVLVHEMNNRIRTITQTEVQNEKLIALGKLSAGLAHELNNPASAMVRSADLLQKHLMGLPEHFKKVIKIKSDDETIDSINNFMYKKLNEKPKQLSLMEQTDLEDELLDWFEDCNLSDKYDLIPLLVEYQFNESDLNTVKSLLREEDFNPVLKWIVQNMTTEKTVLDIKESSSRIEALVQSVKTYSYMDQSADFQLLDIHQGLQSTLNILNHKISKRGHTLTTHFSENMPKIYGMPGELNQVWTNLIENAIDALPQKEGALKITTDARGSFIYTYIQDNGHGIPQEIINRIFEPFFTTKEIGKGTGLGLDIAMKIIKQHNGSLKVTSKPGETVFEVCLPINEKNR
ncbi:ATP-binding protein [Winogradskyella sp.]|uniref:ATP-binding protein n=1 Tax=Winogradskyella sp. TaxID=1883156 RepID=UPI0026325A13|nr:ATP-binding protein [Winogradskyella sp.]